MKDEVTLNFSLMPGGPLFRLLCRVHLTDDALALVRKRVIFFSLLAWLPLLVFSVLQGQLLGGEVTTPFLLDIEAHVRFLVVMPLLIFSELLVHQRLRYIVLQFLERKLIPDSAMAHFEEAIRSATRLRNSTLAEVLLIVLVYGVGVMIIWRNYVALDVATWYAIPTAEGPELSYAGIWYGFLSLPIFQFLICRWYYRLIIWARFLWQLSRIPLDLVPTHPDRIGGLGFLLTTVNAMLLLAVAHGALVAGHVANQILYLGKSLPEFTGEILGMAVFVQCLVFAPLLVFSSRLVAAKWKGLFDYGPLCMRLVRGFDSRWLRGGSTADETRLDSNIQTLASLDHSYQIIQNMRLVPFTWQLCLYLALATLLPAAPLLITMMPIDELVAKFFSIMF